MTDDEFNEAMDALAKVRVSFWTCLNPAHRTVDWADNVATCRACGLTSEMTGRRQRLIERWTRERVAAAIEETIDADVPGTYEAGLSRAAEIARGEP